MLAGYYIPKQLTTVRLHLLMLHSTAFGSLDLLLIRLLEEHSMKSSRFWGGLGCLLIVSVGLVVAQQTALKKMEGVYKVVLMEKAGETAPKELTDNLTIIIKGGKLTMKLRDQEKSADLKIDPEHMPPTLDILPLDPDSKGKTFRAIYKLEKDELLIVVSERGERPKDFKAEGDAILLKLRREK
jgi:uncharacterized protein (TIGR03067 family)